jgi:hypothetical protein
VVSAEVGKGDDFTYMIDVVTGVAEGDGSVRVGEEGSCRSAAYAPIPPPIRKNTLIVLQKVYFMGCLLNTTRPSLPPQAC